jgi:teichuronic acid biosynthesis glycosyltransferase TuaG
MTKPSSISVITPVYNGEIFLSRLFECLNKQNIELEHIVVDDCSTDQGWKMIEHLSKKYTWIKPYRLDFNHGPVYARNFAIDKAMGRYLAFLDADDLWLPSKLRVQLEFMQAHNCALSFTDYRFMSADGAQVGRRLSGFNKIGWRLHHISRYIACSSVMVDRSKLLDFKIPIIEPAKRAEDFLAWSKIIKATGPALRCPHDLMRYAVVPNSRSASKKGAVSVWRIYRQIEHIPFFSAASYFTAYTLGTLWKRFWYRPKFPKSKIDGLNEPV